MPWFSHLYTSDALGSHSREGSEGPLDWLHHSFPCYANNSTAIPTEEGCWAHRLLGGLPQSKKLSVSTHTLNRKQKSTNLAAVVNLSVRLGPGYPVKPPGTYTTLLWGKRRVVLNNLFLPSVPTKSVHCYCLNNNMDSVSAVTATCLTPSDSKSKGTRKLQSSPICVSRAHWEVSVCWQDNWANKFKAYWSKSNWSPCLFPNMH